jgi:HlyD family secretion protein
MIDTAKAIRRNLLAAAFLTAAIGGAGLAWSFHAELEGAVISAGTVMVEGHVKTVQHLSGGIVGEIAVREGSEVAAGDLLIRLDQTMARANLEIILHELTAERARLARLKALRDGADGIVFPDDLLAARVSDPSVADTLEGEAKLRQSQLGARREQTEQRRQRVRQLREQIRGLGEQHTAIAGQIGIVRKELEDLMPLYQSGNIQRPRIKALERELLRNQGLLGDASAQIAEAEAKIAETELQIAEVITISSP